MIGPGIQQLLIANAGVSAIVGTGIYPVILPDQLSLPAATYQQISAVRDYTLDGPVDLLKVRLQIDSWASTYLAAHQLAEAIAAVLDGYSGALPNSVFVDAIELDNTVDYFDSGSRLNRVQQDWLIWFTG